MSAVPSRRRGWKPALLAMAGVVVGVGAGSAQAQEFHLYLLCRGDVLVQGKSRAAHVDLALRDNNMTALIQRSNVLPVGERMRYDASPALYSMVAKAPAPGGVVFHDWLRSEILVWAPTLQQLHTVRLSVDRQTAELEGEMLDGKGEPMGRLRMRCTPKTNDDIATPKF